MAHKISEAMVSGSIRFLKLNWSFEKCKEVSRRYTNGEFS